MWPRVNFKPWRGTKSGNVKVLKGKILPQDVKVVFLTGPREKAEPVHEGEVSSFAQVLVGGLCQRGSYM